jgi:hypothetical protein
LPDASVVSVSQSKIIGSELLPRRMRKRTLISESAETASSRSRGRKVRRRMVAGCEGPRQPHLGQTERVIEAGETRCFPCFPHRDWLRSGDVPVQTAGEQTAALQYNADLPAQLTEIECSDVIVVKEHATELRRLEAQRQAHDCRLAAAKWAYEGDVLARLYAKRQIPQDRAAYHPDSGR